MDCEEYFAPWYGRFGRMPWDGLSLEDRGYWYNSYDLVYLGDSSYRDPWWVMLKRYPD